MISPNAGGSNDLSVEAGTCLESCDLRAGFLSEKREMVEGSGPDCFELLELLKSPD